MTNLFKNKFFYIIIIFVLSGFNFFKLSQPSQLYWDETLHVVGAKTILYHQTPYILHAHPPLGKELLVLSLKLFGDTAQGARVLSVIAATSCLIFLFFILLKLTSSTFLAFWAPFLLYLDPLFYVQARIGMLDIFVLFFLLFSIWLFLILLESPKKIYLYWFFGIVLGFGLIIKSFLVVFYPLYLFYIFPLFKKEKLSPKYYILFFFALLVPPLIILYFSYWIIGFSPGEMLQHLRSGYEFLSQHQAREDIVSRWTDWIFVQTPIWYLHQDEGSLVRTVYLTGNFVFWLSSELLLILALFVKRLRPKFFWFCFCAIIFQFLFWTLKPSTHLYYMLTVIPFYSMFLGLFIDNLLKLFPERKVEIEVNAALFTVIIFLIFVHYYPLLNGNLLSEGEIQSILQFRFK